METNIKKKLAKNWFRTLQDMVCFEIEEIENNKKKFTSNHWKKNKKKDEGGGEYRILENGKILYSKSEATIFIDAVGQAEVGVAYEGRIFICTIGNNFIAASGKSYLNSACYLTEDNAARDASKK